MGRAEDIFERLVNEGEAVISEFIETRQAEELFLEFKQSADNGFGNKLHPTDRLRLAEAISGFGNSEGGVLVWGVECQEIATQKRPLVDVHKFKSWLEHAVSGCTVPPHASVRHHPIVTADSGTGGFVVTIIPKSGHAPHQVTGRNQYYIRAGSSFVPTPHAVLAGMFGRRPQPNIICQYVVEPAVLPQAASKKADRVVQVRLTIWFHNTGLGIARDIFLNLRVFRKASALTRIAFDPVDERAWIGNMELGVFFGLVSKQDLRMPPEGTLIATTVDMTLAPPFTDDFKIEGNFGCDGAPPVKLVLGATASQLTQDFDQLMEWADRGVLTNKQRYDFVARAFGVEEGLRS